MNTVKHPCRNCIYFDACGESGRTEPCKGRVTKSEKKKGDQKCKIMGDLEGLDF